MLSDPKLMAAVSRIIQRSERQEDAQRLLGTYVDIGLLPQLDNRNHQVLYGRRGTGKTHVVKVLASRLREDNKNIVVYVDCRTLGSSSQFSDSELPMSKRCLALFRDLLLAMYHEILEYIVHEAPARSNEALSEADALSGLITEPQTTARPTKIVAGSSVASTADHGMSLKNSGLSLVGELSGKTTNSTAGKIDAEYAVSVEDKVVFPELQRSLQRVLDFAEAKLYLLIDEWSSLPADIQPYLAEFVKRGLLPIRSATVKIAALEYRCRFSEPRSTYSLGIELGADVATAPDLDDYFVFDRNPEHVTDVYADVLRRHMSTELPDGYLEKTHGIASARQFASRLFTERATFAELARAAEGVIRDLINIFTQAYFHAQRRGRDSVDKKAVLESARQWFEQDKATFLDDHLQDTLRRIVDNVIGQRRARSFLLPRALERHPTIQRLFDARVLHHMQRGYADKDNPGMRYNIYAVDYGAYVDLIGTSKEPELGLVENREGADVVVPFDDKRSIRRIVLSEDFFEIA